MAANGAGSDGNRAVDFHFFDKLPKKVRQLLAEEITNVGSQGVLAIKQRLHLDADELLEEVQDRLRSVNKAQTLEYWGKDHPAYIDANKPLDDQS